jgi:peptidoglycan-associated lipoprotein
MNKIMLSVVLVMLLGACAKQVKEESKAAVEERAVGTQAKAAEPSTAPKAETTQTTPMTQAPMTGNPLKDPNNILSKRSVFFEYDSSDVKPEQRALVEAHAKYAAGNKDAKVTLQGNCDERGSREYNIALGQRRADSVKKIMTVLGVPESRIEAVSFGEEKPRAAGHDEASWKENRRTDIVYQGD